jgi:hypothetical protein
MLYTLLPPIERKALRHEYRLRALVVFLFGISVAGTIGIGSLLPAFIRAGTDEGNAQNQLETIKKAEDTSGLTVIQQRVSIGQTLISSLADGLGHPRLSLLVVDLLKQREGVSVNSISMDYAGTSSVQTSLNGTAPTRDDLVAFKSRLETNLPGSRVVLPISELAKGTDVPFSIQITYQLP